MNFTGKGQPLTRTGLKDALHRLGLSAGDGAYIWAVIKVETADRTRGFGFRSDRRPQILFERHIFRKDTNGQFDQQAPDISGPPGGYGPSSTQYTRLEKALSLCAAANLGVEPALRAASWGMGQIMGFNYQAAGFSSAEKMVKAMVEGEDAQLAGMVGFLIANNLVAPLVNRHWETFAKGYNGPSFAENHYDVKLAQQFQRFSSGSLPDLEVRTAQGALHYLGFDPGEVDGSLGPRTRQALNSFRTSVGLPASGDLDGPTYTALCQKAQIDP